MNPSWLLAVRFVLVVQQMLDVCKVFRYMGKTNIAYNSKLYNYLKLILQPNLSCIISIQPGVKSAFSAIDL